MSEEPLPENDAGHSLPVAKQIFPDEGAATGSPENRNRQFRISTLLSWTAVVAILLAFFRFDSFDFDGESLTSWRESLFHLTFIFCFFAAPLTCLPVLIDHLLLKQGGLVFSLFWRIWLTICLAIYSMLMLMLATTAFAPEWKGSKGLHWSYYTLDNWPGTTLWPIYFLGASLFIAALFQPEKARRSMLYLVATLTCVAISGWYVLACRFFNFTRGLGNSSSVEFVPAAAGLGYLLYSAIIFRNRNYSWHDFRKQGSELACWFGGLFVSIGLKYPLALSLYLRLPDAPPDDCFVVSAATRGHRRIVGAGMTIAAAVGLTSSY